MIMAAVDQKLLCSVRLNLLILPKDSVDLGDSDTKAYITANSHRKGPSDGEVKWSEFYFAVRQPFLKENQFLQTNQTPQEKSVILINALGS